MKYHASIALAITLLPLAAFAEGGANHGGTAVVCRAPDQRILSAQMLDLYEGENVYGLTFSNRGNTALEIARWGIAHLDGFPTYQRRLHRALEEVITRARVMGSDAKNMPVDDVFPIIRKEGCRIEVAAVYLDDGEGSVILDREIHEAMDPVNRAALLMHEAVYWVARMVAHDSDSVPSRKLVAHLLGDQKNAQRIANSVARLRLLGYPLFGEYRDPVAGERCVYTLRPSPFDERFVIFGLREDATNCAPLVNYCLGEFQNDGADWTKEGCRMKLYPSKTPELMYYFRLSYFSEHTFHDVIITPL